MSSQAARLGLDQSDQSKAMVVKVAAVLKPRIASRPHLDPPGRGVRGPGPAPGGGAVAAAASSVKLNVDKNQHTQHAPEKGVRRRESPGSPQPERLVRGTAQVARNTVTVATASAAGCGHRLSRNTTGLKKSRTMKSFQ